MKRSRTLRRVTAGALALTLAGIAAACTGVKGGPRPPGVLVVGDSVAIEVSRPLSFEIGARGREFRSIAVGACAPIEGQTALDDAAYTPSPWSCEGVPSGQLQVVNEYKPRTVVWISHTEVYPRWVRGAVIDPYPQDDFMDSGLNLLTEEAYQRLTSAGALLVIVTVPPPTPNAPDDRGIRVALLNDRLRQFAASHPNVGLIDLGALACPSGPPCPEYVDGILLRDPDGIHLSDQGAAWAASIIGPQVIHS